jgi:hypothetical protein
MTASHISASWTVDWVREKIRRGHHQSLSTYLRARSRDQKAEADAAGLVSDHIVRSGFAVSNGHTSVPEAAMRLMRVPGVSLRAVYDVCKESLDRRVIPLFEKRLRANIELGRILVTPDVQSVLDELTVISVMDS